MTRAKFALYSLLCLSIACGDKDEDSADDGPDGSAIYSSKCVVCHGASGDGNSAVLADVVPALSDEELEDVIRNGTDSGMPSALVTDDAEVSALIDYLRATWGG